jgi:hypothetical protein
MIHVSASWGIMHLLLRLLHASQGLSLLVQPFAASLPWPPEREVGSIGTAAWSDPGSSVLPGIGVQVDDIGRAEVHRSCTSENVHHVEIGELLIIEGAS